MEKTAEMAKLVCPISSKHHNETPLMASVPTKRQLAQRPEVRKILEERKKQVGLTSDLRKERPDLFLSRSELLEKFRKAARQRGIGGTKDNPNGGEVADFASFHMRQRIGQNKRERQEIERKRNQTFQRERARILQRLQKKEREKIREKRDARRERGERGTGEGKLTAQEVQEEVQKAQQARESSSTVRGSGIDEAKATALVQALPPEQKELFQRYRDLLAQADSLPEGDREEFFKRIEEQAHDTVDPFFDAEGEFLREGRDLSEKAIDVRRAQGRERGERVLERGVEDITREAARGLSEQSIRREGRGLTGTQGVARNVARSVLEARGRGIERGQEDFELQQRFADQIAGLDRENIGFEFRRSKRRLGFDRQFQRGQEVSDILRDLERFNFLITGDAATNIQRPSEEQGGAATRETPTQRVERLSQPGTKQRRSLERIRSISPEAVPTVQAQTAPSSSRPTPQSSRRPAQQSSRRSSSVDDILSFRNKRRRQRLSSS